MSPEQRLQEIIAAGACFRPYDRPTETLPLAAAHVITAGNKGFCSLRPKNERPPCWRSFAKIEDGVHYLAFKDAADKPLFTIGKLDGATPKHHLETSRKGCMPQT